jgi:hypothetical protein
MHGVLITAAFILLPLSYATAETCSDRASLCLEACTPQNVSSGVQRTVAGCRASCQSRLNSCLRTGTWIHTESQTRGQRQQVERR